MSAAHYDVFLSHNSDDKPLVEQIAQRLVGEAKLRPFLDKWHLIPGVEWQPELEDALRRSRTIAVFIGPSGNGPWHHEEMQVALRRAVREKQEFRVIPVLLPNANDSSMSEFLQGRTWVDFRSGMNSDINFKRLVAGILGQATEFEGVTLPDEPAPYRGLMQFKPEHARFFFGREQDIGPTRDKPNLIDKLRTQRFVAVVGSSGSGKSSLVGAGLLPRLKEGKAIPGSQNWKTVTFTPGEDPWLWLARALASLHPEEKRGSIVKDLLPQFDEPETGLRHTLETWFADSSEPLLLFVDQFEELFTHATSARTNAAAREKYDERVGRFVRQLAHEVLRTDGRFRVVITLRADFMPHCLRMPELKELLQDRVLYLGELATDEAALREVIQRPAQEVGALLETGLMEVLLADVRRQRGALPLLEHALSELWHKRCGPWLTLAAYKETGGVSGALEQRAEETLQRLTQPQKRIARRIFVKLTSLEEDTENTRRRVDRRALYAEAIDIDEIDTVIDILAGPDTRLIVADVNTLSISHETLIQNWPRLRTWLDEDGQLERVHRELEAAAKSWDDKGRGNHPLGHTTSVHLAEAEEHTSALADRLTTLEREFLISCRRERDAETRSLRRRVYMAISLAFTASLMLALAVVQWRQATMAQTEAQDALIDSFFRTIRNNNGLTTDEQEALWELSELKDVNRRVREKLIERWHTPESAIEGTRKSASGLRAAVGLSTTMRLRTSAQAAKLTDPLVKAFENAIQMDVDRVESLDGELASLMPWLEPADAHRIAVRAAEQLAVVMEKQRPPYRSGRALSVFATRLNPLDANGVANRLVQALENEKDFDRLSTLSDVLSEFVARMEPSEASHVTRRIANRLALALDKAESDAPPSYLLSLNSRLVARMEPSDAAQIADQLATSLLRPTQVTSQFRLFSLESSLVALASRLDSPDATRIAEQLVTTTVNAEESDVFRLSSVGNALAGLTAQVDSREACQLEIRFASRLMIALESSELDSYCLSSFSSALAKLARAKSPNTTRIATRVADRLVQTIETLEEKDVYTRSSSGSALAALAALMEPPEAERVATSVANRLTQDLTILTVPNELSNVSRSLSELAAWIDPPDAARLAIEVCTAIENPQEANTYRLYCLGSVLSALAVRGGQPDAARVATRGVDRLIRARPPSQQTYPRHLVRSNCALAELSEIIPAAKQTRLFAMSVLLLTDLQPKNVPGLDEPIERNLLCRWCASQTSQQLSEVLKWPFCLGEAEQIVLAELERQTGRKFDGDVWKFVEQAPGLGIKNLEAPAKRPRLQDALDELAALRQAAE